jgi:pimeloyl-ACP methyl ester carboxylesterase
VDFLSSEGVSGVSYDAATAAFAALAADEGDEVHPRGRSTLLAHGERAAEAYVLLHGLTASPGQFVAFGRRLYEEGANVYVPRMPRHGLKDRLTSDLADFSAAEMEAHAQQSVAIGRGLGRKLTVIGFSVGGLLAAWIAQHERIARVVLVAPFLNSAFVPHGVSGSVARWVLRRRNRFIWWDPRIRERQMPDHGYPRFATHAVGNALLFSNAIFRDAAIKAPLAKTIVFALNKGEMAVNNASALRLATVWKSYGTSRVAVREYDFPRSHDIIEPEASPLLAERAHRELHDLLRSE